MGNIIGTPVGVGAVAGAPSGGGGWTPKDVKEIIDGIRSLYVMAKGEMDGGNHHDAIDMPAEHHTPAPPQKCKVEAGLEDLFALCDQLVRQGQGDTKLSTLIDIQNLTIKDAKVFIGKVIGR